jgi:hypothetical protein
MFTADKCFHSGPECPLKADVLCCLSGIMAPRGCKGVGSLLLCSSWLAGQLSCSESPTVFRNGWTIQDHPPLPEKLELKDNMVLEVEREKPRRATPALLGY